MGEAEIKIGERIRKARQSKRMSQADLAEATNISLPTISAIECGRTSMMLSTYLKVVEALQISSDVLLRPNTPDVNSLYQGEFYEIFSDCSASELDSLFQIVRDVKKAMREQKDEARAD